jgi:hypothetical protein
MLVVRRPCSLQEAEELVISKKLKLIVLDSIAFLARTVPNPPSSHHAPHAAGTAAGSGGAGSGSNAGQASAIQRNELLGEVSSRLKSLSERLGVFVVVTNQVTPRFHAGLGSTAAARSSVASEHDLQAALGVAWAHAVNTRFLLQTHEAHRYVTVAKVRRHGAAIITAVFGVLHADVHAGSSSCLCVFAARCFSPPCSRACASLTPSPRRASRHRKSALSVPTHASRAQRGAFFVTPRMTGSTR